MTATIRSHHLGIAAVTLLALGLPGASPAAAQDQSRALVAAYNRSGQELFATFAKQPGNIVFSPYSIGTAMAMVLSGARGETQSEMSGVLRHTSPGTEVDAANAAALALLDKYNVAATPKCPDGFTLKDKVCEAPAPKDKDEDCTDDAQRDGDLCVLKVESVAAKLKIANALMLVNKAATVTPAFTDTLRKQYGAEIFRDATLETVNNWTRDKTEGKIEKIIERLNPNDSHVLLNAIYFNAPWAHAFSKSATRPRDFNLTGTEKVEVPMMAQQSEFALLREDNFSAIRMPYAVEGLSMIVVRPNEVDGLAAVAKSLDGAKVSALIDALAKAPARTVSLSLPRFKTAFEAELIAPFKALGMSKVFDPAQSDLSGMTGLPRSEAQSTIDQIVHKAVIEVAEEGTEAAAVTAVVVTTRTMAPGRVDNFHVDRPFLFMIVDDKTGAILFEGRITDPRS